MATSTQELINTGKIGIVGTTVIGWNEDGTISIICQDDDPDFGIHVICWANSDRRWAKTDR